MLLYMPRHILGSWTEDTPIQNGFPHPSFVWICVKMLQMAVFMRLS